MTPAEIITILGGLGSAAGTVYGFYRLVIKPTYAVIKKLRASFEILEKMQEEFKPNGGSSLRDAINRIETKLLIEQQARRAMTMAMDVGIFETDGQGMCTWINQYYSDLTGLTNEEAKNLGWVTGIFEDDRERVVEEWESAVKHKRSFKLDFGMVNGRNGEYAKVHCDASPITNIKAEVVGFVGIVIKYNKELIRPKYITGA